jgi:hypothetical protein
MEDYIRQFANAFRGGISSQTSNEYIRRIKEDIGPMTDAKVKAEAVERIIKISNHIGSCIEDKKWKNDPVAVNARASVAAEIDGLADFVSGH